MSIKSGETTFSKRWKNLEDFIKTKKSKKDKDEALSHAHDLAEIETRSRI